MAWITISEDDVLTVLNGKELEGIRKAALSLGQPDPVLPVIVQVVDLVRGYVGACKSNALGAGSTIPSKLLAPALDLIAVRIPARVGREPGGARKDAATAAIALLEQVARCGFDVESPLTATSEVSSAPTPRFNRPKLQFDCQ